MKKICGYKSKNGTIYESKSKCKEADYYFHMKVIEAKLGTIEDLIEKRLFEISDYGNTFDTEKHNTSYRTYVINGLKKDIAKYLTYDIDHMIMISEEKKKFQKEYDEHYKKQNKPWWYI